MQRGSSELQRVFLDDRSPSMRERENEMGGGLGLCRFEIKPAKSQSGEGQCHSFSLIALSSVSSAASVVVVAAAAAASMIWFRSKSLVTAGERRFRTNRSSRTH